MSFPMYDLPELQGANEALLDAVQKLLREEGEEPSGTSLTQICGYPLRTTYRGRFILLGIPAYGVPGCAGQSHRAFIVVSRASTITCAENLRGGTFAVNSMDSNTGMNLPRHFIAKFAAGRPFFHRVILTGTHRASMEAVTRGDADAAAIDCVTFGLHADYDPAKIAGLRVLAHTSASPSIPFVTSRTTGQRTVSALRRALRKFSTRADFAPLRHALRIERIEGANVRAYDVLLDYRAEAIALGYPRLA
jgi:ABC-type phosphate/phosphonate transport system substrate-binding protein